MRNAIILIIFYAGLISLIGKTYNAEPSNYIQYRDMLVAGDTLLLSPGEYLKGLRLENINGAEEKPIVILSEILRLAVFAGRDGSNTMDIRNSSYIIIEGFTFDGKNLESVDAIKAGGGSGDFAHHITIRNNYIIGHGNGQQTVGISTKITCWDWVISHNIIEEAGTGLYLGNSDGSAPFIRGVIEFNLVVNPIGYCMQIKHQNDKPQMPGIPDNPWSTIISHNVFIKDARLSPDGDRPNLLVGGQPLTGDGMDGRVEIYGNFFFGNPREYLFQGTGNISFHDNILVGQGSGGANFQTHNNRIPKELFIYNNSIYTKNKGIIVSSFDNNYEQITIANAVFSDTPVSGLSGGDNFLGSIEDAASYFSSPVFDINGLDLYPKSNVQKTNYDLSKFEKDMDWNLDFNTYKKNNNYYGAYSGEGENPGWQLQEDIKVINAQTFVNDIYDKYKSLMIFPNPATDVLNIETAEKMTEYEIFNLNGKLVQRDFINNINKSENYIQIQTQAFKPGFYNIILKNQHSQIFLKALIIK